MSLLSQKDRELAIEALQYYDEKLKMDIFDNPLKREHIQLKRNEVIILLNWIKLQFYKNDN